MINIKKEQEILKDLKKGIKIEKINLKYGVSNKKIQRIKEKDGLEELNKEIKTIRKYEIVGKKYRLTHKTLKKSFDISIKTIDNIFKDYSKHGNNLTGEEILRKYKLKPEVFTLIKSKLRLYKASDVISPYTFENSTEEEIEIKIEDAIDESLSKHKDKFINTYDRKFKKAANEAIKYKSNNEYQIKQLQEAIKNYKPLKINLPKLKIKSNDEVTMLISDLHLGNENTNDIINRLNIFFEDACQRKEKTIRIIIGGDLGEDFSKMGKHPGIIQSMQNNFGYGFKLSLNIANLLQEGFLKIRKSGKKVIVEGLTGNHDIFVDNVALDPEGTAGMVIYEMIKRGLSNIDGITINYYSGEEWTGIDIGKLHLILNHGARSNTNKAPADILWKYGSQSKQNIIIMGDKHNAQSKDVKDNAIFLLIPALAGNNDYSRKLILNSYPGYMIIKENQYGIPDTQIKRLP